MGKIEKAANAALGDISTLPIPINEIVKNHGIKLVSYDFKDDISGVLILEKEATIGYNANQHRVRNRFTVAHELGHYILHKDKLDLFVDKDFKVLYRSANGTWDKHETEANEFAACILMPEHLLKQEIEKLNINSTIEEQIQLLAKKFDVSTISMSIRISRLNLLEAALF
jgi:Zn-dependent peptidase ImmA (M78 family)